MAKYVGLPRRSKLWRVVLRVPIEAGEHRDYESILLSRAEADHELQTWRRDRPDLACSIIEDRQAVSAYHAALAVKRGDRELAKRGL